MCKHISMLCLLAVLGVNSTWADEPEQILDSPFDIENCGAELYLAPEFPDQKVAEKPLSKEETQRATQLIRGLADTDTAGTGYAPTSNATAFLPVPVTERQNGGILPMRKTTRSESLAQLVEMGPRVLPLLLENLSNTTPTKFSISHEGHMGGMSFGYELPWNPLSRIETKILDGEKESARDHHSRGDPVGSSYTVKVGDLCFVAIGQIVGRNYRAVRYQMTMLYMINSPTHDERLLRQTRELWSGETPAVSVLKSLLTDYRTRATKLHVKCKPSLAYYSTDPGGTASYFQCESSIRLLYYYPKIACPLIAQRLRELDIRAGIIGSEEWHVREETNKVNTPEFVQDVAWSADPEISAEIDRIIRTSNDTAIVVGCVEGTSCGDATLFNTRCREYFRRIPQLKFDPNGIDNDVLLRIAQGDQPKERDALLALFRKNACGDRRRMLELALSRAPFPGSEKLPSGQRSTDD